MVNPREMAAKLRRPHSPQCRMYYATGGSYDPKHDGKCDPWKCGAEDFNAQVDALLAAIDEEQRKLTEMHRRAQRAEGIIAASGLVEGRPQTAKGRSLGRALANYAAHLYRRELDDERAHADRLAERLESNIALEEVNEAAEGFEGDSAHLRADRDALSAHRARRGGQ